MADNTSSNDFISLGLALAGLALLLFFMWKVLGPVVDPYLDLAWRWFRAGELWLWEWISHPLSAVGVGPAPEEIEAQRQWLVRYGIAPPLEPAVKDKLTLMWGQRWSPFVTILFACLGLRFATNAWRVRAPLDIESMLKRTAKVNPSIAYFVHNNPADHPVDYRAYADNRFAQRVTPWDFARMDPPPGADVSGDPGLCKAGAIFNPEKPKGQRFNLDLAEAMFAWQLGARTSGAKTWSSLSPAEAKVYKHCAGKIFGGKRAVKHILSQHAFIRTALMSLYYNSSATIGDFGWLKYEDRTLWYCLQDAGGEVASVEAAGPFVHWSAEVHCGRPLDSPAIEDAVLSLARLVDVDDEELQLYLKEESSFRQNPTYWDEVRLRAIQSKAEKEAEADTPRSRYKRAKSVMRKVAVGGRGKATK